jgi:hypothetical protein
MQVLPSVEGGFPVTIRLPSRYEDLDVAFRGRLRVNQTLLATVKEAFLSMSVSGGIRFLPIYGKSGCGKTSAALELGSHLPDIRVFKLRREAVEDQTSLLSALHEALHEYEGAPLVAVVDQYEEASAHRSQIPTSFVENLALLDRSELSNNRILFIWLTTSQNFQHNLQDATSRNRRIVAATDFELRGPNVRDWPQIIEETFSFHNQERILADFEILDGDLQRVSRDNDTLGSSIKVIGQRLGRYVENLHDLSTYQVVMLWPVTDGLRINRIQQFTDARQGYKLDWTAWLRQLNADDQRQLPLPELNRARLYFDVRLVPIAAADLQPLCRELDDDDVRLYSSYLERFKSTHFFSIVNGIWNPLGYSPMRERNSERAETARDWYASVNQTPTKLGRRIAKCLDALGLSAAHERSIESPHSKIRADVLIERSSTLPSKVIVEIKAFAPENTMPSTICEQVKITLRRAAQFAGFLRRQ